METNLQRKLLDKYSEFFSHTKQKIYIREKPMIEEIEELAKQKEIVEPIQFGIETGNGWYVILDTLMQNIKWYLENKNRYRANEFKYKWMWNLQTYLRRKHYKKPKLKAFAEWLYKKAPRKKQIPITVNVTQIKEKFSGLRFYYNGGDDIISGMVNLAESMSYKTCEICGTTKNVGCTKGWLTTCCLDCLEKNEKLKKLVWEPLKEK